MFFERREQRAGKGLMTVAMLILIYDGCAEMVVLVAGQVRAPGWRSDIHVACAVHFAQPIPLTVGEIYPGFGDERFARQAGEIFVEAGLITLSNFLPRIDRFEIERFDGLQLFQSADGLNSFYNSKCSYIFYMIRLNF